MSIVWVYNSTVPDHNNSCFVSWHRKQWTVLLALWTPWFYYHYKKGFVWHRYRLSTWHQHMRPDLPDLLPPYLHTASDQRLEVGTAWDKANIDHLLLLNCNANIWIRAEEQSIGCSHLLFLFKWVRLVVIWQCSWRHFWKCPYRGSVPTESVGQGRWAGFSAGLR